MRASRRLTHHAIAAAALLLLSSAQAATYTWSSGTFVNGVTAPDPLAAADTLNVVVGGAKYLNSAFTSHGTINASDWLYFQNGNVLASSGLYDLQADVGLWDGGYNGGFNNTGIFRKSGGSGISLVQINGFINTGTINTQVGTLQFISGASFGAGSQFTGTGSTVISNGASFSGALTSANLALSGGGFNGTAAQINGIVNWTAGSLTGGWSVAGGQTLAVSGGGVKYLNGALANLGTVAATDNLYFQNSNTLTNQALFDFQGDVGFYDGAYNGNFVNSGTLRKSAGAGTSYVSINGYSGSGVVEALSGTINFNAGAAFNNGSQFTGAGSTVITNGASFSGALTSANLSLSGGGFNGTAAQINGFVNWTVGSLTGDWSVAGGQTLAVSAIGTKYMNGALTNLGTVAATDNLYFQNGNTLTNQALFDLQGDVGFYDGAFNGNFVNSGTLRKSAGSGTSYVSINGYSGTGVVEAQTGTINFNSGAVFNNGSQFSGAGQVVVSNNASFNGGFTTAGNLTLAAGAYTGTAATMNGDVKWTGGRLDGGWEVAAGRTLSVNAGSTKYINGTLTNNGVIDASADLYFINGNTLANQALYDFKGDVGLHDGGFNGYFANSGTLRKSMGTGTSYVSIAGYTNSGVIEAQSGAINFNAGAVFNNGSQFTGTGQVVVSNNASFNGGFTTAGNLYLAAGAYTGNTATMNGDVIWTGGRLDGVWVIAAGKTLSINAGGTKYVNGSVTNNGTMAGNTDLYFLNGNTLVNQALYDFKGDYSLADGGFGGNVINSGTLVKSAGVGVSSVAAIGFSNSGVVDVRTGTLQLPSNFTNSGTLMGVGNFSLGGTLSNAGHVAPGASPGTLTLSGHFAQTALGSFDVELGNLASSDLLLVSGNATLGGTLALSCWGACSYAVGDMITVLDASGSLDGIFATMTLSGFASGAFQPVYDLVNSRVLLQVTETVTAVPEPETWALMLGGLAAVGWLARRRRA